MPRMSQHEINVSVEELEQQERERYERDVLSHEEGYIFPEMFPIVIYRQPSGNSQEVVLRVIDGLACLARLGGGDMDDGPRVKAYFGWNG